MFVYMTGGLGTIVVGFSEVMCIYVGLVLDISGYKLRLLIDNVHAKGWRDSAKYWVPNLSRDHLPERQLCSDYCMIKSIRF